MTPECVFFAPCETCTCGLLQAANSGPMPDGIGTLLRERYCATGRFIVCPIFERFQHSLARAHHDLDAMRPRQPADDATFAENTGVHLVRRRRGRRSACG